MTTTGEQGKASGTTSEIGQVLRIPRNQIRRFSGQPRTYFDTRDMADLSASIEEIGQQTPIVVKAVVGDPKHKYELIDGERRWIACGMAGVDTMLAWVKKVGDTEEQFVSSVVGNFGRSGHTALEIAQAIDRIRQSKRMQGLSSGEQIARIAKTFARSEVWVYQHLTILRLHPEVQAMMSPTIPEKERLNHSLGIFISSLHHDLQMQVAKEVLAKGMSLNRARLYARQVAEQAGVRVGISRNRTSSPSRSWRSLGDSVRLISERLDILLTPSIQEGLKQRSQRDQTLMAAELERCVVRLKKLQAVLLVSDAPRNVVEPKSVASPPPPVRTVSSSWPPLPPPPRPVPPPQLPTPKPPPDPPAKVEQSFELSRKVMLTLFYQEGQPKVNLSRSRLEKVVQGNGNLEQVVRNTFSSAKSHWQVTPTGDVAEQNFARLMHRFRRDFGGSSKFHDVLRYAMDQDKSKDPVYPYADE